MRSYGFQEKLIYISGLLTCFSCPLDAELNSRIDPERDRALQLVNHLRKAVKNTPLEVLANFLLTYDNNGEASKLIFTAYDEFLGILNNAKKREHLQNLRAEDSERDLLFVEIRRISDEFQQGLDKFFFDNHNIHPLTRKYGVF
jgi:hypothetical protein